MKMRCISYYPRLNEVTGDVLASLLMTQLEYWFSKKPKKFFKFAAPCEHRLYHEGDSWEEELGFSRGIFRTAFSRIGVTYKSRKAYLQSKDKFQGKFYLSYYDRMSRLTYYKRNDELIERRMKENNIEWEHISIDEHIICGLNDGIDMSNELPFMTEEFDVKDKVNGESSNRDFIEVQIGNEGNLNSRNQESLNGYTGEDNINIQSVEKINIPTEKIKVTFNTICASLTPISTLTPKHMEKLDQLWTYCKGSLKLIEAVFRKAEESDFLAGRIRNKKWRASFEWLIEIRNFRKVLDDKYQNAAYKLYEMSKTSEQSSSQNDSLGNSQGRLSKFLNICKHEWDFDELERLAEAQVESLYEARLNR